MSDTLPQSHVPWAFIAHKNGYLAGIASAELSKKELRKFLGEFATEGFTILTVHSRDEYNEQVQSMKHWHDSPEYQAKTGLKKKKP